MADQDINITFSDGPSSGEAAAQAAGTPTLGNGIHEKEESQNSLFERLFSGMTDSMSNIFNLLSGEDKSSKGLFSSIKDAATGILGGKKDDKNIKGKGAPFIKAAKITGLKPQDINIVDQQYILGALLINDTLTRIESLIKANTSGKKAGPKVGTPTGSADKGGGKGESKLGELKETASDFDEINQIAAATLPIFMSNLKLIKWSVVFKFFKNFKKAYKEMIDISKEVDENKKEIDKFFENSKKLIGGCLITALGLALIGILLPLIALSVPAVYLIELAIKPMLNIAGQVANNKDIGKFPLQARKLFLGMLFMSATVVLLAIMAPFLLLAIPAVLLLSLLMLGTRLLLLVFPKVTSIAKALPAALLLIVFFAAVGLATIECALIGAMDWKKVLIGLGLMAVVAIGGTVVAAVLGIPFVLPFVALGTVTALCLALFFTAIMLAIKVVAKTGQYTDEAIASLGHVSKMATTGDDGTEHKDSTGILGFFSTLASWPFIKALLIAILVNGVLAIDAVLLFASAILLNLAFKEFAQMSEDYFPIGKPLSETKPGAAIMAIKHFTYYLAGKEDEKGTPINGEAIVGWKSLLMIAPLFLYGFLLKFTAQKLIEGMKAFEGVNIKEIQKAGETAEQIGQTLNTINNALAPSKEEGSEGFIDWILGKVLGGDVENAVIWLKRCLPLLSLMLYGYLLEQAATPLQKGIEAIGQVDPSKVSAAKMSAIGTAISGMITPIQEFTKGFQDHSERYGNIVNAICDLVAAFPGLIDVIIKLSKMDMTKLGVGLVNFAGMLSNLIGTPDSRSFLEKMGETFSFGLWKSDNGAKQGSLLAALQSIKDNDIKVNDKVFSQVVKLMEDITPLSNMILQFANLDEGALQRGLDGFKILISNVNDLTGSLMGNSDDPEEGGWGAINKVLDIVDTNQKAKVAENNPLYAIVDLFNKMGDMKTFMSNIQLFNDSMESLKVGVNTMNNIDMKGFKTFVDSLSSEGLGNGVAQIDSLLDMMPEIQQISNAFYDLGSAIDKIAKADMSGLNKAIKQAHAAAEDIIKASKEAEQLDSKLAIKGAADDYVEYIARVLDNWDKYGVRTRGAVTGETTPTQYDTAKLRVDISSVKSAQKGEKDK